MCKLVRACDYSPKLSRRPCDCHTSTADGINATIQSGLLRRITFIIHPGTKSAWFRRRRIIMRCLERRKGRQDGYVRLPGRDSAGPNGISPCFDPPLCQVIVAARIPDNSPDHNGRSHPIALRARTRGEHAHSRPPSPPYPPRSLEVRPSQREC